MTHVVTDACIRCKYTDCVDVCPVDCFKEGPGNLLKVFSGIALECNRDEWMLRTRGMGPCPCKRLGRPIARFHSNPSGKCLFGRSAALRRLPIARAIGCTPRLAPHPEKGLARPRKDLEQVPSLVIDQTSASTARCAFRSARPTPSMPKTTCPKAWKSFCSSTKSWRPRSPQSPKEKRLCQMRNNGGL